MSILAAFVFIIMGSSGRIKLELVGRGSLVGQWGVTR